MQSCIPTIPAFPPTPSFHCISESIFLSHLFNIFTSAVCAAGHIYLLFFSCKVKSIVLQVTQSSLSIESPFVLPRGNVEGQRFCIMATSWPFVSRKLFSFGLTFHCYGLWVHGFMVSLWFHMSSGFHYLNMKWLTACCTSKTDVYGLRSGVFFAVTVYWTWSLNLLYVPRSTESSPESHSCILLARTPPRDGRVEEVKKKKKKEKRRQWESSAWICECVWQRGQPWRRVPAPQHRKWHMTALTFVIPCLPPPLKLSLKQTPRLAKIHTLKDTQSHTHTVYCLDYIIFIPRTWALLVGWHLGLCSTKVTFPWPWVKMPVCSMHLKWRMRRKEKKKRKSQMRKISKSALIRGINSHAQTC